MADDPVTENQTAAELAYAAAAPHSLDPDNLLGIVVPPGAEHRILDLEKYLYEPRRTRGTVTLHDPGSLADYVLRHKTDQTQWYVDIDQRSLVAVLNDHNGGEPGWRDHRASVQLRHTPEWKAWTDRDRKLTSQEDFADHLEQNRPDIVEPPAAELLELVQTFQANTNVTFKRAVRDGTGEVQLTYNEQIDGRGGRDGQMLIPEIMVLEIAPFQGQAPVTVEAALRYRVREGQLAIGYVLLRPERVVRDAIDQLVQQVKTAVGIEPLYGAAPAAL